MFPPRIVLLACCVYLSCCVLEGDAKSFGGKGSSRQYRQIKAHGYYNGRVDLYSREPPGGSVKESRPGITGWKTRAPGLSAWSIVTIILSVIFIGFAFYYFYLFYPIFCKKERQYNSIELVV